MALPPSLSTITVTATFLKGDGTPDSGYVEFSNQIALVSSGDNVIISPYTVRSRLNDAGQIAAVLPATNDPDWQPSGWTWQVVQQFDSGGQRRYSIELPYDAAGATVDLADLVPVQASSGSVVTVSGIQSVNGDAGPAVVLDAADVGADQAGTTAAHTVAVDPHGDRNYADGAVTTHSGATDPHGDRAFTTAAVATHTAAVDPHGDRAYADTSKVAKAGDTMTGALTAQGSFTIRDSATPTKQYRFRTLGSDLDIDFAGRATFISVFTNADFTGTQRTYFLLERDEQLVRASGVWRWFANNLFGTVVHQIDPLTGVAHLGAKNGLTNIRVCGFKNSAGAPAAGAWDAGDLVLDSAGVWHLCTAGGTPGTWT